MTSHTRKPAWRSLEDLHRSPEYLQDLRGEFSGENADAIDASRLNRRKFMGMVGLSGAAAALSGCVRKPLEKIVPHSKRPEDLVPGVPRFYATSAHVGGGVVGMLVESHEGRPTKIEGNARHPMSHGASNAWAQAELMNLYDPDRSQKPRNERAELSRDDLEGWLAELSVKARADGGKGLAILADAVPSPTLRRLLLDLRQALPQLRVFSHDPCGRAQLEAGLALTGLKNVTPSFRLSSIAKVIVALDADLLGTEGDMVRVTGELAAQRSAVTPGAELPRLYVVEPAFSVTGIAADNRLRLASSQIPRFLEALCAEVFASGIPAPSSAQAFVSRLRRAGAQEFGGRWIKAVAADLAAHPGHCAVVVGERHAPEVHALSLLLNVALGALGQTLSLTAAPEPFAAEDASALSAAIDSGAVQGLVVLAGNPAFDLPGDLGLAQKIAKLPTSVHLGLHLDETSAVCKVHIPKSHFLEAWGDLRASDGTVSIQQPLIAPLYESWSAIELVARLLGRREASGYEVVRETWKPADSPAGSEDFERRWRRWLHEGVATERAAAAVLPTPSWDALAAAWQPPSAPVPSTSAIEAAFVLSPAVLDGRYANNGWLQELPDPASKLTWGNAALLSPATAKELGVESGEVLSIELAGKSVALPAFVVPGTADFVVVLPIGYGRREGGSLCKGVGADVNAARTWGARHFTSGVALRKTGAREKMASTQEHGSMEDRPLVREATLEEFGKEPAFAKEPERHLPPLESLWTEPNVRTGQQWGMTIDLSACTGCNACVVACQAENNIPTVGKERVLNGREMHWIRMDRYFTGTADEPAIAVQPMACTHCETAPCEGVCPVGATAHSPEGLNDMAYNRCIGTRYCSNNCPTKVRRFNFFNYNLDIPAVAQMQKNPDVTVRFRGVMEKCTYCVQRINKAKIVAKRSGDGVVPDGAITPACAQACPAGAIVFGDVNNPMSAVARSKANPRNYGVLEELNIHPRTTYLARVRNPNPELE